MIGSGITRRLLAGFVVAGVLAGSFPSPASAITSPSALLNFTAAAGDDMVLLRWTGPLDDGGAPITSYRLDAFHSGVVVYQGELIGVINEAVLGPAQFAINTAEIVFGLGACNEAGCGPTALANPVLPTAGAATPQIQLTDIPAGGGSAATDDVSVQPSASNPVITAVTVPPTAGGGALSIAETTVGTAPSGYTFLGQDIVITSTAATDSANPLSITFRVDAALAPFTIFRNGLPISDPCTSPGVADPTPCIADGEGTAEVTVLSAAASTWNIGIANYAFGGFASPVDNLPMANLAKAGRAIPVRFDLGGDQGLNVFAPGYPKSYPVPCEAAAAMDGIEETLASSSQLGYSVGTGQYQLGWNTDRSWAGTCRELVLRFRDGSDARARFAFR